MLINRSRNGLRSGLSLVEVVAGLALMGTLLVFAIIGTAEHFTQIRHSERKKEAVHQIENLLTAWAEHDFRQGRLVESAAEAGVRLAEEGFADKQHGQVLQIASAPVDSVEGLELELVTVEAVGSDGRVSASLQVFRHSQREGG